MIKLAPFKPADFKKLISWMDSEELLVQVAGPIFTFPLTEEQLFTYLEDQDRHAFTVVEADSNQTIGHAEIYITEEQTAKICRILIGDPSSRGKGLGQELISLLVDYSVNVLKIPHIELNVYDWNTQAIKCYEKVGFRLNPEKFSTMNVQGDSWLSLNMVFEG